MFSFPGGPVNILRHCFLLGPYVGLGECLGYLERGARIIRLPLLFTRVAGTLGTRVYKGLPSSSPLNSYISSSVCETGCSSLSFLVGALGAFGFPVLCSGSLLVGLHSAGVQVLIKCL